MVAGYKQKSLDPFEKNAKDLKSAGNDLEARLLKLRFSALRNPVDQVQAEKDALLKDAQGLDERVVKCQTDLKSAAEFNGRLCKYGAISSIITVAIIVAAVAALAFTGYLSLPLAIGAGALGLGYFACAIIYTAAYESNQVTCRRVV